MKRSIFLVVILIVILAGVVGSLSACGGNPRTAAQGKYQIERKAVLSNNWQMYQLHLTLAPGSELSLNLLNLAGTDKVDGYFYPEKGTGVSLEITAGLTNIYKADAAALALGGSLSDRFSFTATQTVGTAYILKFRNAGSETVTEFVELIYPKTGSLGVPIDLK